MTGLDFGGVAAEGIRQAPKMYFMSHPSLRMLLFLVLTWSD